MLSVLLPSLSECTSGVAALANRWPCALLFAFPPIFPTLARLQERGPVHNFHTPALAIKTLADRDNAAPVPGIMATANTQGPAVFPSFIERLEQVTLKTDLLLSLLSAKCVGKAGVHKIIGIFFSQFPPFQYKEGKCPIILCLIRLSSDLRRVESEFVPIIGSKIHLG